MINKIFENPYHKKMIVHFLLNTFNTYSVSTKKTNVGTAINELSDLVYMYFCHLSVTLTYCNRFVSKTIDEKKLHAVSISVDLYTILDTLYLKHLMPRKKYLKKEQ